MTQEVEGVEAGCPLAVAAKLCGHLSKAREQPLDAFAHVQVRHQAERAGGATTIRARRGIVFLSFFCPCPCPCPCPLVNVTSIVTATVTALVTLRVGFTSTALTFFRGATRALPPGEFVLPPLMGLFADGRVIQPPIGASLPPGQGAFRKTLPLISGAHGKVRKHPPVIRKRSGRNLVPRLAPE